jgi:Spy/CpxP family protein refolding chaperone
MRALLSLSLSLAAVAALALTPRPAAAQFQMKGMNSTPLMMILMSADVQKELKLTEAQNEQIQAEMQKAIQSGMEKIKDLIGGGGGGREKIAEFFQSAIKESDKSLRKMLKPDQVKRLDQLKLQADGPRAFKDASLLAEGLEVSAEQKTKIDGIVEGVDKELRKLVGDKRPTTREEIQEMMEKMNKARKEVDGKAMEQILAVLTAEQRERWTAISGPRFEGSLMPSGDLMKLFRPGK